jgi:hypothetical protein
MKIIFYPYKSLLIAGCLFVGITFTGIMSIPLFSLLFFPIYYIGAIILALIFLLPILFSFSKKYIFDVNNKVIVKKNLFYSKKLYDFSDIYEIETMISQSDRVTYSLILKNDKYGYGIKLNLPTYRNSKNGRTLEKKVDELNAYFN